MPSSSPSRRSSRARKGSRVYVVDAQNKVEVAKVKPVDDYQGLRVLESGLEAGQKVIVEGIQLVRPGQVVEPVEVPLEQYIRETEPRPSTLDPRFRSPISRRARRSSRRRRVEPSQEDRAGRRRRPTPKAEPDESSDAKPETKAR